MLRADLYEKRISLESYVSTEDCCSCGFHSREEFIEGLRGGKIHPRRCSMDRGRMLSLLWAARPEEILPDIEVLQLPTPATPGLFPVNDPNHGSPVLVSGNSQLTIEVLTTVLSTTTSPFWYLVVNTDGHTVDMALVFEVLSVDRVEKALSDEGIDEKARDAPLFLPGLAVPLCDELSRRTSRSVFPGPVCAAELPVFFGERQWKIAT